MKDKNLQLFFSGLDSFLERGWIQSFSSSFQIPDGWGISVFTSKTIVLSFNHVLLYSIINCRKETFKRVIKHLGDQEFINLWPIYKEWESNEEYGLKQLESNQIYDALSVLNFDNSNVLLNQINCTVGTYTELKDALAKKDKDRFINAISDCNTSCINLVLANILFLLRSDSYYNMHKNYHCGCCDNDKHTSDTDKKTVDKSDIAIGTEIVENQNSLNNLINTIYNNTYKNTIIEVGIAVTTYMALKHLTEGPQYSNKYIPNDDVLLDSVYYSYFFQYCRLSDEHALDTNAEYAYKFIFRLPAVKEKYNEGMEYWKNNCWEEKLKEYGLKIRNLLFVEHEKVIDNSQSMPQIEESAVEEEKETLIPVKNDFIEQEPTKHDGHLYPDSKYGFIPENYFDQKIDKAHPDDHYNLVEEVQEKGEEQFFDFITYLVKKQYIENNDEQKALFAYRLTGRLRPKDDDLPPVWWSGKNNSPKELLYIIRYCVDFGSKKKFSKQMKDFFEGPDWPTKGYSTIADWADTPFREALHEMYEVCGLKYNQPKKKKKKY